MFWLYFRLILVDIWQTKLQIASSEYWIWKWILFCYAVKIQWEEISTDSDVLERKAHLYYDFCKIYIYLYLKTWYV